MIYLCASSLLWFTHFILIAINLGDTIIIPILQLKKLRQRSLHVFTTQPRNESTRTPTMADWLGGRAVPGDEPRPQGRYYWFLWETWAFSKWTRSSHPWFPLHVNPTECEALASLPGTLLTIPPRCVTSRKPPWSPPQSGLSVFFLCSSHSLCLCHSSSTQRCYRLFAYASSLEYQHLEGRSYVFLPVTYRVLNRSWLWGLYEVVPVRIQGVIGTWKDSLLLSLQLDFITLFIN